ncbi:MAG: glycosyltransferase family 2 protein, partial [Deltaproteobacteria bacterium]|nr:glycosyltransferase family 2 protein [Deltaproteobacteria bacterium]
MKAVAEAQTKIDFTIVIPVYNEEDAILETVETVKKTMDKSGCKAYELIIVDDGSTDQTPTKLEGIDAKILTHHSNCGYGASLKTGIRAATGDTIIIADADGTYPLAEIPRFISSVSDYDMVVGARAKGKNHTPWYRRFFKFLLGRLGSYVVGAPIPDLNSGFRAVKKDILMKYFR